MSQPVPLSVVGSALAEVLLENDGNAFTREQLVDSQRLFSSSPSRRAPPAPASASSSPRSPAGGPPSIAAIHPDRPPGAAVRFSR
jgi:hypothetical protein